jgi:poly(A) polymerase
VRFGWGGRVAALMRQCTLPPAGDAAAVAAAIERAGAVVVGGAVRDALIGATPADVDWLAAEPEALARAIATASGATLVALDPERGFWRVGWGGAAGVWDFAAPTLGGDPRAAAVLTRDLARRDFTINAMAFDPSAEQLIDPHGGASDLRRRHLRMIAAANLHDDPLRGVRGVRLAARLGLRIEAATAEAIAAVAAALAQGTRPMPAAERLGAEFDALLLTPRAAQGVAALVRSGWLALLLPELTAGAGVAQGPLHHLDVLDHQIEALAQLIEAAPDADLALRYATLLHDVGKCVTRTPGGVTAEGVVLRDRFDGHDAAGAALAERALKRLRRPRALRERVAALIAAHMRPLPRDAVAARRFAHRLRPLLPDLLQLMVADRAAARGRAANAALRRRSLEGVGAVLAALEVPPPAAPLLRGGELIAELALAPGPQIAWLLAEIAEARAAGDVATREEALAYARRRLAAGRGENDGAGENDGHDENPTHAGHAGSGRVRR